MDENGGTANGGTAGDAAGDAARSKREARARFLARRATATPAERARTDAVLCAHLLAFAADLRTGTGSSTGARAVHAYWPAPERGEPDLAPALAALHAAGVAIALPRVAARRPPTLAHHVWDGCPLAPGAFGLLEPTADAPAADLAALDLVVVPALAVDRRGVRLGYGGGYYDAFLAALLGFPTDDAAHPAHRPAHRPVLACVLPGNAVSPVALPSEPHDIAVDVVVTESGVAWRTRARS